MLYAEDLTIGQRFPFRTYPIEQAEIIDFAERFDPLFIHIDPVAAAKGRSAASSPADCTPRRSISG